MSSFCFEPHDTVGTRLRFLMCARLTPTACNFVCGAGSGAIPSLEPEKGERCIQIP
jgi:hypothetical protein